MSEKIVYAYRGVNVDTIEDVFKAARLHQRPASVEDQWVPVTDRRIPVNPTYAETLKDVLDQLLADYEELDISVRGTLMDGRKRRVWYKFWVPGAKVGWQVRTFHVTNPKGGYTVELTVHPSK